AVSVVIACWKHPTGNTPRDASIPQAHVLVRVADVSKIVITFSFGLGFYWNSSIRRIDNKGRPSRLDDGGARVEPELIVRTDIARLRRAIHPSARGPRFQLLHFFFRQELLPGKLAGPLKRGDCGVGPHTLQVGLPIGSF